MATPGASAFANPFAAIGEKTPMFDEDGGVEIEDDDECVINVPSMEQIQMVPVNSYGESRAVAVEGIQKTVTELAEIYKSVSLMVQAQHEMVESIDKNVDATVENVESAQEMWSQYLESISSNRVLIMKILSILLAFGLFFIIFLK